MVNLDFGKARCKSQAPWAGQTVSYLPWIEAFYKRIIKQLVIPNEFKCFASPNGGKTIIGCILTLYTQVQMVKEEAKQDLYQRYFLRLPINQEQSFL